MATTKKSSNSAASKTGTSVDDPKRSKAAASRRSSGGGSKPKASGKARELQTTGARRNEIAGAGTPTSGSGPFRDGTKGAAVVALLRSKTGASISDLVELTGWQSHSVRGFLSGTLKKKLGLGVVTERDADGVRRYRIAS